MYVHRMSKNSENVELTCSTPDSLRWCQGPTAFTKVDGKVGSIRSCKAKLLWGNYIMMAMYILWSET
jgi:hypothetical protein